MEYFGHYKGFKGILPFFMFRGILVFFLVLGDILVIFRFLGYFGHFLGFRSF